MINRKHKRLITPAQKNRKLKYYAREIANMTIQRAYLAKQSGCYFDEDEQLADEIAWDRDKAMSLRYRKAKSAKHPAKKKGQAS